MNNLITIESVLFIISPDSGCYTVDTKQEAILTARR